MSAIAICQRKRPLKRLHAENLARMNAGTFNAYYCPCGDHWHIGHPPRTANTPTPYIASYAPPRITIRFVDGYETYCFADAEECRFVLLCLRALL